MNDPNQVNFWQPSPDYNRLMNLANTMQQGSQSSLQTQGGQFSTMQGVASLAQALAAAHLRNKARDMQGMTPDQAKAAPRFQVNDMGLA